MKNFILIFILGTVHLSLTGQSETKIDNRLIEFFGEKKINQWKAEGNDTLSVLQHCLDYGLYITEYPEEKGSSAILGTLKIDDLQSFNPFESGLTFLESNYQYFRVEGTSKMIVLRSMDHILNDLKR